MGSASTIKWAGPSVLLAYGVGHCYVYSYENYGRKCFTLNH
ncbi:hypothetical protein ACI7YW_09135 [Clostridium ljungdahlii]